MKRLLISLIATTFTLIGISAQNLSRYELNVNDFTELRIINGVNVNYICNSDSAGKAVYIATDETASALIFNNNKGRLEIRIDPKKNNLTNLPTVNLYSKFLTKVENHGDSIVKVLNITPCPDFKGRLVGNGRLIIKNLDVINFDGSIDTGNGQLIVNGKCTNAKLSCTGTGTIQADDLVANDTKCVLLGTGSIGCKASKNLNVAGATSGGKVYYKGDPEQIKNRSVGAKLVPLDNEK